MHILDTWRHKIILDSENILHRNETSQRHLIKRVTWLPPNSNHPDLFLLTVTQSVAVVISFFTVKMSWEILLLSVLKQEGWPIITPPVISAVSLPLCLHRMPFEVSWLLNRTPFLRICLYWIKFKCFKKLFCYTGKSPREWGAGLMSVLPLAKEYIISQAFYVDENLQAWY